MDYKYDKRIITAARVLLFALGGVLGWLIMNAVISAYPAVMTETIQIVAMACCALLLGVVLMLSAKPFVYLTHVVFAAFGKLFRERRPIEIVGVFLGVILGLMIAYLTYSLLTLMLDMFALNVFITVVVAVIACTLGAIGCSHVLRHSDVDEDEPVGFSGYVVDASAFTDKKLYPLLSDWLDGKAAVLGVTSLKLMDSLASGEVPEAAAAYKKLVGEGRLKSVEFGKADGDEKTTVAEYAATKRKKIITADKAGYGECAAPILDLSDL